MKKNVLWMTILMAVLTVNTMAQTIKKDSLSRIPLGSRVDFRMDFSSATIHDRTETEFAKYEKDWEIDKPSIVEKFRSSANLVLDKELKFGEYPDADYLGIDISADAVALARENAVRCGLAESVKFAALLKVWLYLIDIFS